MIGFASFFSSFLSSFLSSFFGSSFFSPLSSYFGFSGLPEAEQALRLYLARPVIVALGRSDTGDASLDQSVEAKLQGANRYDRGRNAFDSAKREAARRGWSFVWTLIEVEGVGHSSTRMFTAAPVVTALQPAH